MSAKKQPSRKSIRARIPGISGRAANVAFTLAATLVLVFATESALAQTFRVTYRFRCPPDAEFPIGLVRDGVGAFYGNSGGGGKASSGTLFKLDHDLNFEKVLYNFQGGNDLGSDSAIVRDAQGDFYGSSREGGGQGCDGLGCGTVFRISQAGKRTLLHAFQGGQDGSDPVGGVIRDGAGNLYGTTQNGGDLTCGQGGRGCGTVFKITKAGKKTELHRFNGADGDAPLAPVIRDAAGNLYGTTTFGGGSGAGTVFKLASDGTETVLHSFKVDADGWGPLTGLKQDAAGNLYGTTSSGGNFNCLSPFGCGTVFQLSSAGTFTTLHIFDGSPSDGAIPSPLVLDTSGNVYGTTQVGGKFSASNCSSPPSGCGTVFKLDPSGKETILHNFTGLKDGQTPTAPVILDKRGNVFGIAPFSVDGKCNAGTVFKNTP
jgi:uncharacterized repeat protein (TIGR03803 family)